MATGNKGGRPRLADAEKAKKGTLEKSRVKKKTIDPPKIDRIPDPPDWLGKHGREEWKVKCDQLDRMNMLHKTDLGILASLCNEWHNYVEAELILKKTPRYYQVDDPKTGQLKYIGLHPAHTIAQQHLKSYITLCNEFGFSPASRSRLSMPTDEKIVSKAAALLKKAI